MSTIIATDTVPSDALATTQASPPDGPATFRRILVNTLLASVTSTYLSFAMTFWVYLETKSVLAASLLSGVSMLVGAMSGTWSSERSSTVTARRRRCWRRASSPWSPSPPPG